MLKKHIAFTLIILLMAFSSACAKQEAIDSLNGEEVTTESPNAKPSNDAPRDSISGINTPGAEYEAESPAESSQPLPDTVPINKLEPDLPSIPLSSTMLTCGLYHTLALKDDGSVWSWGRNSTGQLGDGSWKDKNCPVKISSLDNVRHISSDVNFNIAVKDDGSVWTWGENSNGQLGTGNKADSNSPVRLDSLTGAVTSACGGSQGYAILNDGSVWAWGFNYYGMLGDGTQTDRYTPVKVNNLSNITQIAASGHCLALDKDGFVWSWGRNEYGQLGNGSKNLCLSPAIIGNISGIVQIAVNSCSSYALKSDGTVWTWGLSACGTMVENDRPTEAVVPQKLEGLTDITSIYASKYFNLIAVKKDGTVWGMGLNFSSVILKDITVPRCKTPVLSDKLQAFKSFSCGYLCFFGIKENGTVWSIGYNEYGQLGTGNNTEYGEFTYIPEFNLLSCQEDPIPETKQVWSVAGGMADGLFSIAGNNKGLYVCVGRNGRIKTSEDLISWKTVESGTTEILLSIIWDGKQFITTGHGGFAAISSDGATWKPVLTGTHNMLKKLALGDNKVVAVGNNGTVLVTSDGMTWEKANVDSLNLTGIDLRDIIYDGKQFIAVGTGGTIIQSQDGIAWNTIESGISNSIFGVAADGNRYIAVSMDGVLISDNGFEWTKGSSSHDDFMGIMYADGRYVAIGDFGLIADSIDGLAWRNFSIGTSVGISVPVYLDNQFIILDEVGRVHCSADGVTWESRSTGVYSPINDAVWNGKVFVAVGNYGTIIYSEDGLNWNNAISPSGNNMKNILWTGNKFVASNTIGEILSSTDGMNWTYSYCSYGSFLSMVTNGQMYVAVGEGGKVLYSPDGVTWERSISPISTALRYVIWAMNKFIAVGDEGTIIVSSDGINWTAVKSGTTKNILQICSSDSFILCLAGSDEVLTSSDGLNWSKSAPKELGQLDDLIFDGTNFVGAGSGGIMYSIDGITWTSMDDSMDQSYSAVVYANGTYIVFGRDYILCTKDLKLVQ